jgi:hypothetical protein
MQRDWYDDPPQLATVVTQRIAVPAAARGVPSAHEPNRKLR